MNTYLLLRSNKQTGPYSLDQLLSLGLKPYDLVWIENKSAAWRYPSEVEGLKEYAPPVEEQPYDRFYKKPAEEKPVLQPQPKQEEIRVERKEEVKHEEVLVAHEEVKPILTTKKVFVSMPENHAPKKQVQPEIRQVQPEVKYTQSEQKFVQPEPKYVQPEPVKASTYYEEKKPEVKKIIEERKFGPEQKKPVIIDDEPTLNEKYSESLDDIKKRYAETYLSRQKKPKWTATHSSILQIFGGAVFFCVLVVVAYKNFGGDDDANESKLTVIQPKNTVTNTTPTNTPLTVSTTPEKIEPLIKRDTKAGKQTENTNSIIETKEADTDLPNEMAAVETKIEKKAVMPPPSEEKTEEVKKPRVVNINRLVSVKANNYKQRAFGGVMNLELTVDNESKFELDRVIVELQYLKPSEQPLKTDRIVFNSVAPGGSQTLKIPDYLRGIKVSYRILEIESSQYDNYTAGL